MISAHFALSYNELLREANRTQNNDAAAALARIVALLNPEDQGTIEFCGTAYAIHFPPTDVPYGDTTASAYDASLKVGEVDIDEILINDFAVEMTPELCKTISPLHKLITQYVDRNDSDFNFKDEVDEDYDSYDD